MTSKEAIAAGRAGRDWMDGCSYDENPYQIGTDEHEAWQLEMNRLVADEIQREMMGMTA